jgi:hypothetical protein
MFASGLQHRIARFRFNATTFCDYLLPNLGTILGASALANRGARVAKLPGQQRIGASALQRDPHMTNP